jgi:hypothetical protein
MTENKKVGVAPTTPKMCSTLNCYSCKRHFLYLKLPVGLAAWLIPITQKGDTVEGLGK